MLLLFVNLIQLITECCFAKNELTIEGLSVWNERCCKLNDSINVVKEMVDVREEFKECQGFSREEVEGFIEMLCID